MVVITIFFLHTFRPIAEPRSHQPYIHDDQNMTVVASSLLDRLDVRKFSFSQRTINVWNKLSTGCVHASSVNMFKNIIDKYLVKAGYT